MTNGMTIFKLEMAIEIKKRLPYVIGLVATAAAACGAWLFFKKTNEGLELKKYETSIKIAAEFYGDYFGEGKPVTNLLEDAWRRPFKISTDKKEEKIVFRSCGSNPKTVDEDLTVEISKRYYRHAFEFANHLDQVIEHSD